ncbi:hypothetical protein [Lysobacter brunescens]|uniref:Transmembrane protein n=1 Tax=Lysobacter brunescens TaxID=262323 RepID=A0ABW2YE08_9GAMM
MSATVQWVPFALALLSSPGVAWASDYTGFGTLLVGYPCAVVLVLVNLVFSAVRKPGTIAKSAHMLLSSLCLLGILIVLHDAFALIERASGDAVFFLLLAGGGFFLFLRNLAKRPPDPDAP